MVLEALGINGKLGTHWGLHSGNKIQLGAMDQNIDFIVLSMSKAQVYEGLLYSTHALC